MANPELTRYALREATEKECRDTLGARDAEIIEWETTGQTFILSVTTLCIVRAGSLGGDTREVEGGWRYLRPEDASKEWREIRSMIPSFQRREPK